VAVVRGTLGGRRKWSLPSPEYEAIRAVRFDAVSSVGHSTLARKVLAAAFPEGQR
jgi:hypothetical protein